MQQKYTPRTVGFKPGEMNVFLHLLTACNLACKHCYINRAQHGAGQLNAEQIEKWLKLFATPDKVANLILLGGEPTLHPDLPFAVKLAKQLGYSVTVDSNGYLFHDFLDKVDPVVLDYLSFSLDGPDQSTNDPIRGEGVFDVCTENIKRAVARGFSTSVIYTVSQKNITELHRMGPLLETLGVKKFFIQVIGLRGKSALVSTAETGQVDRQQWLDIVPKVAEEIAERSIHVTYPKVFLEDDEKFECAGNVAENYFIFPNGRVYQCPLCEDHPIHSFEIVEDRLNRRPPLTEAEFFPLNIPEGCVMNRLLQSENIEYTQSGQPLHRISCCLLKQEIGDRLKL